MRYALIAFMMALVSSFALYGAQAEAENATHCALPAPVTSDCAQ